jgi:hypothetical protein
MTTKETYNRGLYWTPTIALCAGLIFSSVYWLTTSGRPNSIKVAEVLNAPTYWAIFVLPIGQLIAAIFILNRKMPTARIFAYAFVLFYNLQLLLLLLQGQGDPKLAALEAFKIAVWGLAFLADRDRIAKSLPK